MSSDLKHCFIFTLLVIVCACEKAPFDETESISMDSEVGLYVETINKIKSNRKIDNAFLFFTDPHNLSYGNSFGDDVKSDFVSSFSKALKLYDELGLDFCLSGGDWLDSGDTQYVAKQKLLYADNWMKTHFGYYYKMMGNHDTNYQGIVSTDNTSRGDFSRSFIDNEYFNECHSAYFSFVSNVTRFFILDSELDRGVIDNYKNEQLMWFASELENNHFEHIAIGIHMFYNDVPYITVFGRQIANLCDSYNQRREYQISDRQFDFSESTGVIHFILTGHCHVDFVETINNIPIIGSAKFMRDDRPFDIVLIDYSSGCIDLIRVGDGDDRHVTLF